METRQFRSEVLRARLGVLSLGAELDQLERVFRAGGHTAVVFHCARVLEAACAAALEAEVAERIPNVFASLARLEGLGLLGRTQALFFHTLRRLGNEVRHLHREVQQEDATISLALLERLLDWYFVRLGTGPSLESIHPGEVEARAAEVALRRLEEGDFAGLSQAWERDPEAFLLSPVLASLYGDAFLSLGEEARPLARALVSAGLQRFPRALRLRQLDAWLVRLEGNSTGAQERLEGLADEFPEDLETMGLLAGTYKRQGSAQPSDSPGRLRAYRKAKGLYLRAWRASKRSDTYAGINAATLALWTGEQSKARETAREVESLFARRRGPPSDYWDQATVAEALLLQGRFKSAREAYRAAIAAHPDRLEWHQSSLDQLQLLLPHFGIRVPVAEFLNTGCQLGGSLGLGLGIVVEGELVNREGLLRALAATSLGSVLSRRSPVCLSLDISRPSERALAELFQGFPRVSFALRAPETFADWLSSLREDEQERAGEILARAEVLALGAEDGAPNRDALVVVLGKDSPRGGQAAWDEARHSGLPACLLSFSGHGGWTAQECGGEELRTHLSRSIEAAGYRPAPLPTETISLPPQLHGLLEDLAKHIHDSWALQRLGDGWRYGPRRDDESRQHPCLIAYEDLTEEEREYDRVTVKQTLKAILALGFELRPPSDLRSGGMRN